MQTIFGGNDFNAKKVMERSKIFYGEEFAHFIDHSLNVYIAISYYENTIDVHQKNNDDLI